MLPNEAPRTKNTADTIFVLTVSRGLASPRTREFRTGEPQDAHSVGSAGDWQIRGPGVEPVHAYLYFDGVQLYLQSALEGRDVLVGSERVGTDWRAVPIAAVIELGTARITLSQLEANAPAQGGAVVINSGDFEAITGEERTAFVSLEGRAVAPAAPAEEPLPNFSGALRAYSAIEDDEKTRFPAPQRPAFERPPLEDDEKTRFPTVQKPSFERPALEEEEKTRFPTVQKPALESEPFSADLEATRMFTPDRPIERQFTSPLGIRSGEVAAAPAADAYDDLQEPTQMGKSRLMTAAPHTPTGAVQLPAVVEPAPWSIDPPTRLPEPAPEPLRTSGASPARRPLDERVLDESTRLAPQREPSRIREAGPAAREPNVQIREPSMVREPSVQVREPSMVGARRSDRPVPDDRPSKRPPDERSAKRVPEDRPSKRPPEDRPSKAPPRDKRSSREVSKEVRAKHGPANFGDTRPQGFNAGEIAMPSPAEMTRVGEPGSPAAAALLAAQVNPTAEQQRRKQKTARVRGPDGSGPYQPPPPPMPLPQQEQAKAPKPPSALKTAFNRFAQHFEEVNRVRKALYLFAPFVMLSAAYLVFGPKEQPVSRVPNVTTADPPPDAGPAQVASTVEKITRPDSSEAPVVPAYPLPPVTLDGGFVAAPVGSGGKPSKGLLKTRERLAADAYEAGRYPEALALYREMATDPATDAGRQRIFLDIIRIIELKIGRGPRESLEQPPAPKSIR